MAVVVGWHWRLRGRDHGGAVRRWSVTSGRASSAECKHSIRETRPGGRVPLALRAGELGSRHTVTPFL